MDWQMGSESVQKDLIWCPRALYMEMSCITLYRFGSEDSREMVVHLIDCMRSTSALTSDKY